MNGTATGSSVDWLLGVDAGTAPTRAVKAARTDPPRAVAHRGGPGWDDLLVALELDRDRLSEDDELRAGDTPPDDLGTWDEVVRSWPSPAMRCST